MATESSAVVRFINLVQSERVETSPPTDTMPSSAFGGVTLETAAARPNRGLSWLAAILAVAVVVAGGVAAAYVLHERGTLFGGAGGDGGGEAPGIAPPVAQNDSEKAEEAAEAKAAPAPEVEPVVGGVEATGFDLLVTPAGAQVSLDGETIGIAPLRVRSITAGRHTLDVAAPEGYFGHHTEIEIEAGKAEVIKIELARVDGVADDAEEADEEKPAEADAEADEEEPEEEAEAPTRRVERRRSVRESRRERRARRRAEKAAKRRAAREERKEKSDKSEKSAARSSGDTGTLMIGSKPPCDIYIDGKKTGLKTPQRSMVLDAGVHSIRLVSKEHDLDKRFKVRVANGKTTRAIQDFTDDL